MPISTVWRGGATIIAGASRNKINLNRPWQEDLDKLLAQECPFETKPQEKFLHLDNISRGEEEWRVLRNHATPWTEIAPDHFLIIPQKCWPKNELRRLGYYGKIAGALSLAGDLMYGNSHGKFELCVHVGRNAGQNVGHAHFHLLPLPLDARSLTEDSADMERLKCIHLAEIARAQTKPTLKKSDKEFMIFCDGTRAGQCFVVPHNALRIHDWNNALSCARKLDDLLGLLGEKFRSVQGLPPDFVMSAIIFNGCIEYATIIPILSQWGGPEYMASLEHSPYSLPWQHEVTADYLNADNEQ